MTNIMQMNGIMEKLTILSDAAKYDVACTSSGVHRGGDGKNIGNAFASGICHAFTGDGRKFMRFFFAGAANCELDKQGRILLPANLREYAGIDKEVVSVGVFSRVEIWSKDRYLENSDFDDMDEIAEHMAELGIGI